MAEMHDHYDYSMLARFLLTRGWWNHSGVQGPTAITSSTLAAACCTPFLVRLELGDSR
jgi:hypothetical protein